MLCFDISLNGQHLCRAGVGPRGVISAIVSWVRRRATPGESRKLHGKRITEELLLDLGGMVSSSDGTRVFLNWLSQGLKSGDEVTIKVVTAPRADPPRSQRVEPAATAARDQREYYERLKKHFGEA